LSASDICGDLPPEVDGTVCAGDTILHNKRQQSDVIQSDLNTRKERSLLVARERAWRCLVYPDTLEAVGVNELFVAVTVDASFTTEQAVVGRIDKIHILIAVRTAPIVGYVSPSQICDVCALLRARKLDMEMPPDSLEDFLTKAARVAAPCRCLLHPHFRAHVQLNVCSLGWVIESITLRSVASACLSFAEPTNR
jgi:hypothetical protein